ncbi:hypothetical protein [Mycobacterium riyadhense]|uniref:hypothetical protein n=1 Tax=Mycobacterium riyadhense TaxID=486698 RepID=UPI0020951BB9|nr:hypothetical protein [Mycobacterium riyadhense]
MRGPVRNHLGRIELTDMPGGGTRLEYRIAFDTPAWLPGRLLAPCSTRPGGTGAFRGCGAT